MITLQEVLIQKEELVEPYRNKTDALASTILIIATLVFVLGHIAVGLFKKKKLRDKVFESAWLRPSRLRLHFPHICFTISKLSIQMTTQDGRKICVRPYMESLQQTFDVVSIEIAKGTFSKNPYTANVLFPAEDAEHVPIIVDKNGRAKLYDTYAEIYVDEQAKNPYVVMTELEEGIDRKHPSGVYRTSLSMFAQRVFFRHACRQLIGSSLTEHIQYVLQ